ncbi:MAG: radical SAM protein [Anaerolineae bacterium]
MAWRDIEHIQRLRASERGAVVRDWGGKLPIVLAYANSYAVGMSSLAIHSLYSWFNAVPGVVCERAFAWLDKSQQTTGPLLTLETQQPVAKAAVLAVSLSFELDYLNLLTMLSRAGISLRAAEREEGTPIVLLGGPAVSANPEPLADIADAIVIGEIEPILSVLVNTLKDCWSGGRQAVLGELAIIPGVYVPSIHQGQPIWRQVQPTLDPYLVASSIGCPQAEFGDMHLIEISRGCEHACRFCLAGSWYHPLRERSLEQVVNQIKLGVKNGLKIGLVAAAVSDYSRLGDLLDEAERLGAHLSVSSLRVDSLSAKLLSALANSGERSITLAPEAGSERLREAMHKGVTEHDIYRAASLAAGYPFDSLKLYFMLGLPGETDDDMSELVKMARGVKQQFGKQVVVNITPFVPKAHTPWQRQAMAPIEVLNAKLGWLKQALSREHIVLRAGSVREAVVQAIFARGDRALGGVLAESHDLAGTRLIQAMEDHHLDVASYLRERSRDEQLPWHFILNKG